MKFFLLIFFLFPSANIFSQKQANVWYFGGRAGLDFSSGAPVPVDSGQTNLCYHQETSVICDSSGSLLFYSDGNKVWNKNHQLMPNGKGLLPECYTSNSALIIPQPASNNIFYLLTISYEYPVMSLQKFNSVLKYSVIDMRKDNRLGDIIDGKKNIILAKKMTQKISVTRHFNGIDYWIVVHELYSDKFYSFLLTENGITDTVVSQAGSVHLEQYYGAQVNMKISPDGKKLALTALTGTGLQELFDFNNATGIVSNFVNLAVPYRTLCKTSKSNAFSSLRVKRSNLIVSEKIASGFALAMTIWRFAKHSYSWYLVGMFPVE